MSGDPDKFTGYTFWPSQTVFAGQHGIVTERYSKFGLTPSCSRATSDYRT